MSDHFSRAGTWPFLLLRQNSRKQARNLLLQVGLGWGDGGPPRLFECSPPISPRMLSAAATRTARSCVAIARFVRRKVSWGTATAAVPDTRRLLGRCQVWTLLCFVCR